MPLQAAPKICFPNGQKRKLNKMDEELLEKGLSELNLFSERNYSLLVKYIEEIERFNPAYGLVKVRDRRELILKHILDSLAPFDIIASSKPMRIADVGSGAGLPGIPLAICMPEAEFTLIERMGRRAGFLLNTLAALSLSNVRVEENEMEKLVFKEGEPRFDLVLIRALKPLDDKILKGLLRMLEAGGVLAAYKGRRQSIEEEMAFLSDGKRELVPWEIIPLKVPFLKDERHLLMINR